MRRLIGLAALAILLVMYLATLQTIPNGSEHYYMIDVGETQNVLNQWGTLHATGYPLYVMISNVLVAGLRTLGVDAATAPGVTSLIYGMIAMGLLYVLAAHVIEPLPLVPRPQGKGNAKISFLQKHQHEFLAGWVVLLFGLTRTVWVHNSIAEVYSFGLMILAVLLLIALWREPIRGRVYWLALLGGIGAFHHRAIAMAAPALVYAVWWEIVALTPSPSPSARGENNLIRRYWLVVRRVGICLVLGLVGFLPYIYLSLRANAGAKWVYGEPGTWNGFWDQFLGREASRFIGTPTTNAGLLANFNLVNTVLVTDLMLPVAVLLGIMGLLLALRNRARRKVAITMLLSGGVAYVFHVLFYTDILSALILPVTLALAFGWLLLAEWVLWWVRKVQRIEPQNQYKIEPPRRQERQDFLPERRGELTSHPTMKIAYPEPPPQPSPASDGGRQAERRGFLARTETMIGLGITTALFALLLFVNNLDFIREMTTDPTGLKTIELAKGVPDGVVLMLDWGPRYYAVAFAHDLLGDFSNVTLVTHKADFKTLVKTDKRELVTADFTFYNRPVSWWEVQLGSKVYLSAVAPHLVAISIAPTIADAINGQGVEVDHVNVVCTANTIELEVDWVAASRPEHDLSVFVHLLDKSGAMIGQADEAAPVYGWRPLTSWEASELVHDVYGLPRLPNADSIAYGLYRQLPSGEFQNEYTFNAAVKCEG